LVSCQLNGLKSKINTRISVLHSSDYTCNNIYLSHTETVNGHVGISSIDILRVRVMVFNGTFNNISIISWRQFYWWRKPEYTEKTTNLSQDTDKRCFQYTSPWAGFELTILVVIGTDYIGSCKSNYHMITTTTVPLIYWSGQFTTQSFIFD